MSSILQSIKISGTVAISNLGTGYTVAANSYGVFTIHGTGTANITIDGVVMFAVSAASTNSVYVGPGSTIAVQGGGAGANLSGVIFVNTT